MSEPLVSCICLTADRPTFLRTAIEAFHAQDWPNKELVIVDSGRVDISEALALAKSYTYLKTSEKHIGALRNSACSLSRGGIIAHWDDDDWSDDHRLTDQVERLLASGKSVTAYNAMLFFDGSTDEVFRYKGTFDYGIGTSLCFTREFWDQHTFTFGKMREDNVFVQQARNANQIVCTDAEKLMVARIHPGNTAPKEPKLYPRHWQQMSMYELPEKFMNALGKEFGHAV
jgi:glycosyltransferase involved in cell wall biosynthesis